MKRDVLSVRILDEPPVPQFRTYLMDSLSQEIFFNIPRFSEHSAKTKVIVILVAIKT